MKDNKRMPDPGALLIAIKAKKKGEPSDGEMKDEQDGEDKEYDADEHLTTIAEDLLKAIDERDVEGVKDCLRDAFECLESEPHEEAEEE